MCQICKKWASSLFHVDGLWICRRCSAHDEPSAPYFKEMGAENPIDPKGSTAHVRDIKDRRWHPEEKRMFYYSKEGLGKTYFFLKG